MTKEEYIRTQLESHYEYLTSLGYRVVGVFLQGSQNYNLDIYEKDYMSDIDTKCIVLPTLRDLIEGNKMTSTKYDFEGGQIDVKDIRMMMEMWKKQNQSYLEILYTDYKIINPRYESYMNDILNMCDDIVKLNPPQLARCINGMSEEKVVALENVSPATKEKIEKYQYDPKQLASIIRLTHLIKNLFERGESFKRAIWYEDKLRDYMIDIKKGNVSLIEARKLANIYNSKTNMIKERVVKRLGKDNFNNDIYAVLKKKVYSLVKFGIAYSVVNNIDN